jgi:hypothetical protein
MQFLVNPSTHPPGVRVQVGAALAATDAHLHIMERHHGWGQPQATALGLHLHTARARAPACLAPPQPRSPLEKRLSRNGSQEIESAALTHQSLQLRAARGPEGAMQADHHICEQPAPALAGLPPSPEACAATLRVSVELTSEPRLARACAVSE